MNNCEFCSRVLALSSHSVRPSVDKRHMSIYANIYTDFEHWFQYISYIQYIPGQTRPDHLVNIWLTSCSIKDAESAQFTPSSFPKFLKCENDQNLILQKSSPFHHVRALKSNKILNISLFDLVRVPNPLSQTYPGLAFCFKKWHKTAIFPSCRNWPTCHLCYNDIHPDLFAKLAKRWFTRVDRQVRAEKWTVGK